MWVAICVPLVIGAIALVLQRVEACLDRSQVELATVAHAPKPRSLDGSVPASEVCHPPVDLDLAPALGLSARGWVCGGVPRCRSVSR
jgi:hypothetical protein